MLFGLCDAPGASTDHGRHSMSSQMASRTGVFGTHRHLFSKFRRTHLTWSHPIVAVAKSKRHLDPEEMQMLSRKDRLPDTIDMPRMI